MDTTKLNPFEYIAIAGVVLATILAGAYLMQWLSNLPAFFATAHGGGLTAAVIAFGLLGIIIAMLYKLHALYGFPFYKGIYA